MAKPTVVLDISNVKIIFNALMEDVKGVLSALEDDSRLDAIGYASVVAESIKGAQAGAVEIFLNAGLKEAQIQYEQAKIEVTRESRIDNLIIEASKAQEQKLATVGAGGLVPSTTDFKASNDLRNAIYVRAKGGDLPNITFTAGTTYTVAK